MTVSVLNRQRRRRIAKAKKLGTRLERHTGKRVLRGDRPNRQRDTWHQSRQRR